MVFSIETFATSVCLVYGTGRGNGDVRDECFDMTEYSYDVNAVIYKLYQIFEQEFNSILKEINKPEILEPFDSFMKASMSKYVKISENPTYFNFMLVSALIHTITFEIFSETQCFTFAKVSSLCITAVYERYYKRLFEENEKLESLGSYCKRMNPSISFEDGRIQLPFDHQEIVSLLASVKDVDHKNFDLTDFEKKLLDDALDLVPPEGHPVTPDVSSNTSYEAKCSFADEANVKETANSLNSEEQEPREYRICVYCDAACSEFLLLFETEVAELIESENN